MGSTRRAAIDIGTVTTRLLVADVVEGRVDEVSRTTIVTHLGRGLHGSGSLQPDAIERVAAAVASFSREIASLGVEQVSAVATAAGVEPVIGGKPHAPMADLIAKMISTPQRPFDPTRVVMVGDDIGMTKENIQLIHVSFPVFAILGDIQIVENYI